MTQGDIIAEVSALPQLKDNGSDWGVVIPKMLPSILDDISQRFDWDFMLREYSTSTVANQAEYALQGAAQDLGDIVQIRYDDDEVLQNIRRLDAYDIVANNSTVGGVKMWYQSGVDGFGFPKVTLVDTPSSVKTLKVLYRKKMADITKFPDHFQGLIVNAILMRLGVVSSGSWDNQLREKIRRHKSGGKDYNPAQIDPHMQRTQQKISGLYGTG